MSLAVRSSPAMRSLGLVPEHEAQALHASLDRLAAMFTRLRGFAH